MTYMGFGKGAVMNYRRKGFIYVVMGLGVVLISSLMVQKVWGQGYQYESLRGLSDAEILEWMGEGKREPYDWEVEPNVPNHLPKSFWEMEPQAAAMAFVDANRTSEHRKKCRLVFDRTQAKPPEVCSVSFSDLANHSQYYDSSFIHSEPNDSYFIMADQAYGYS